MLVEGDGGVQETLFGRQFATCLFGKNSYIEGDFLSRSGDVFKTYLEMHAKSS